MLFNYAHRSSTAMRGHFAQPILGLSPDDLNTSVSLQGVGVAFPNPLDTLGNEHDRTCFIGECEI